MAIMRLSPPRSGIAGARGGVLALAVVVGLLIMPSARAVEAASEPASGGSTPTTQKPVAPDAPKPPVQANQAKAFPSLVVTPAAVNFGSQPVGSTSVAKTVTLAATPNSETASFDFQTSGAFAVSPTKCELAASGSCALSVTFSPAQPGATDGAVVAVDSISRTSRVVSHLDGNGITRCDAGAMLVCRGENITPVIILVLIYLVLLLTIRWHKIAVPTRRLLLAEIEAVEARVATIVAGPVAAPAGLGQVSKLLAAAKKDIPVSDFSLLWSDALLWSSGRESAGWGLVHEAEEQLAVFLDQEQVRASLERSETLLRQMTSADAAPLAQQIQSELGKTIATINDRPIAVLEEIADFLGATSADIRAGVASAATQQAPAPAIDTCSNLAGRLSAALSPQATALIPHVVSALAAVPPAIPSGLLILLEEARDVVLPKASGLAATLSAAVAAGAATQLADWIKLLATANDYLATADKYALRVQAALSASPRVPIARWRALLAEALGVIYQRRDTDFATLVSWHNKTSWLTSCGLLLIVALSGALGNEVLFLLGATGGLLSRLSRSLYRQDVPTDYGASWTTLFLSPVVGALGGWAGVLIVALAEKLGVLGPLFESIRWASPYSALAYGLAFLFGFSERAFNTVLSQLEDKVVNQSNQTSSSKPIITTATTLTPGKIGQAYSASIAATGGKLPLVWSLTSGSLPTGLTLDQSGKIVGTPTTAIQDAKFTLQAKDSAGAVDSRTFSVSIQ